MALTNRQEMILTPIAMKELFVSTMKRAKSKYHFTFHNFCIMNNHIHFILEPAGASNLSRIMQWILSVFAAKYNKIHHLKGHVWYDRFKSAILENIFQFINTYIYVMNNPVAAGLVKYPIQYRYNGITFIFKGMTTLFESS